MTRSPPATRFVYDGGEIAAEVDGAGNVLRRYVTGAGAEPALAEAGEPLVWYEGAGTGDKRWLIPDERGSIIAVTSASGQQLAINAYDDYGIPASTNLGRFQYTGQAWLPELGLYYYKARMYSATLGRFLQTDPIGYGDGPNWYNYAHGDPVNGTDPSGLDCVAVGSHGCDPTGSGTTTVIARSTGDCLFGFICDDLDSFLAYIGYSSVPTSAGGDGGLTGGGGSPGIGQLARMSSLAMLPQQAKQPTPTANQLDCFQTALQHNFASLALDTAGALLFIAAPEAKVAQLAVASGGLIASAFTGDVPALFNGITGYHSIALDGQFISNAGNLLTKGIGAFTGAASVFNDLRNVSNETSTCRRDGGL